MGSALARIGVPTTSAAYSAALEGLTSLCQEELARTGLPGLYETGVKYKLTPYRVWRTPGEIVASGWGDCENLSSYRSAELRNSGEDPSAHVQVYPTGPGRFHAVVIRDGGSAIEDPSKELGMSIRDPAGYYNRLKESFGTDVEVLGLLAGDHTGPTWAIVGSDFSQDSLSFDVVERPNGKFAGELSVPLKDGRTIVTKTSDTDSPEDAAAKGARMTSAVAKSINAGKAIASLTPQGAAVVKVLDSPAGRSALSLAGKGASALRKLF